MKIFGEIFYKIQTEVIQLRNCKTYNWEHSQNTKEDLSNKFQRKDRTFIDLKQK